MIPRAASAARSPCSRAAAPARSRHQPSGRAPITLATSTRTVTGWMASWSAGQATANPGCSGSALTSSWGTHATSGASALAGQTGNGLSESATRVWYDQPP